MEDDERLNNGIDDWGCTIGGETLGNRYQALMVLMDVVWQAASDFAENGKLPVQPPGRLPMTNAEDEQHIEDVLRAGKQVKPKVTLAPSHDAQLEV